MEFRHEWLGPPPLVSLFGDAPAISSWILASWPCGGYVGVLHAVYCSLLSFRGQYMDASRFVVKMRISESEYAYNHVKFTPKGIEWIASL